MTQHMKIEPRLLSSSQSTESKGRKSWWILGSLIAAGGALAVVLFSRGGQNDAPVQETVLPEPPGLPED